jgi:nucleotide-binding universal stress UspA family protein
MSIDRIVVGYDGSGAALRALAWAVREASLTGAVVHVVTAWTVSGNRPPDVGAMAGRLRDRQATAICTVIAGLSTGRRPVVTSTVVMADAATALALAAQDADLVVVAADTDVAQRLNTRLARWPRRHRGPCPVRVVDAPAVSRLPVRTRDLDRTARLAS